jgi:H+/Cl- antiporter ClcA
MASVTRLTVALAVIMVEISDDVHLLLPVLTGEEAVMMIG